ncbi:MAG TPA: aldo/keto reductase [Chloroflexota bacterium]|nr:aldo/keto reductase [Chloroflexota bacterium]
MRYQLFGRSGLRVSELCLGTMTFGEVVTWGTTRDESRAIFDAFVEAGGNFVDTANVYTRGTSERLVGEFIAAERERYVVGTKYTMCSPNGDPNVAGNQRKNMVQSLEASLKRLGTDYVDLYWVHAWDFVTPVEEVMRGLDDLVRSGKVLYIGISNAPAWVIAQANTLADLRGWTSFAGIQVNYSLIERTAERDLLPMARSFDLAVAAWSPLAGGLLTGKYNLAAGADPRRLDSSTAVSVDARNLAIAAAVQDVVRETDFTPSQVALAWVRQDGTIPVLGARTATQITDNLACLGVELSHEHTRRLNDASQVEPGFPHDFLARDNIRNSVFGGFRDRIDRGGRSW